MLHSFVRVFGDLKGVILTIFWLKYISPLLQVLYDSGLMKSLYLTETTTFKRTRIFSIQNNTHTIMSGTGCFDAIGFRKIDWVPPAEFEFASNLKCDWSLALVKHKSRLMSKVAILCTAENGYTALTQSLSFWWDEARQIWPICINL